MGYARHVRNPCALPVTQARAAPGGSPDTQADFQTLIDFYLLPGLDGTGKLFDAFIEHAPAWANPIRVSYASANENSYDYLVGYVTSKIDPARDHVILGESFSGPIAIRVAFQSGGSLLGLVLSATFISSPPLLGRIPIPNALLEAVVENSPQRFLAEHFLLNGNPSPALLAEVVAVTQSLSSKVVAERITATRNVALDKEIAALHCPLLYLRATRDRVVPSSAGDEVKSANQHASIVDIDSPHMILQCNSRDAWAAVSRVFAQYR